MTCLTRMCVCVVIALFGYRDTLVDGQQFEGETCAFNANSFGECKRVSACDSGREDIRNGKRPEICSYEKNEPIICCLNQNTNWLPAPSASGPLWPSESNASPPPQRPTQRPTQTPPQRPPQGPSQRPTQTPPQRPPQRPPQGPSQRPTQRPTQTPSQRPPQRPPQRPVQPLTPTPPPLPEVTPAPPVTPTSQVVTPKRPQWWQIPKRKMTESPAVIEKPTSPMPGAFPPENELFESNQLPTRVQEEIEKEKKKREKEEKEKELELEGERIEEEEKIVFQQDRRK